MKQLLSLLCCAGGAAALFTGFDMKKEELLQDAADAYEKVSGSGVILEGVDAVNQYPDYPDGCEAVSLYMLMQYYDSSITMEDVIDALPIADNPYQSRQGFVGYDPEEYYIGNPAIACWGSYNGPIAEAANTLLDGGFTAETGASLSEIRAILDSGNPVEAWRYLDDDAAFTEYTEWIDLKTGKTVEYPLEMHAVVIYGYDSTGFWIADPNGGTTYHMIYSDFEPLFEGLGSRIVYRLA